jgi:hypothetical protein
MTVDIKKAAMRVLDVLALRRQLREQRVRLGLEPPTPEQEAERFQCKLLLSLGLTPVIRVARIIAGAGVQPEALALKTAFLTSSPT